MKKVVLISGGNDGLGRAVAEKLKGQHQVVILGPATEDVERAAKEMGVDFVVADVSKWEEIEAAVESVVENHGRIDCLVNNAGVWLKGPIDENDPADIKRVIDVNTTGVILLNRAVVPIMKRQKSGTITHTISQSGLYGKAGTSVYVASKWALTGLNRSLQTELAPFGIRVIGLYPTKMKTTFFEKAGDDRNMSDALDPEVVADVFQYIIEKTDGKITFPEIGMAHLDNLA